MRLDNGLVCKLHFDLSSLESIVYSYGATVTVSHRMAAVKQNYNR